MVHGSQAEGDGAADDGPAAPASAAASAALGLLRVDTIRTACAGALLGLRFRITPHIVKHAVHTNEPSQFAHHIHKGGA